MEINDDNRDNHVDEEICKCVSDSPMKSFFLFAGAGSGKTKSLVALLKFLKTNKEKIYNTKGKKIAVITYTKAACNEIIRRIGYDELFLIATIHSFSWELIKYYPNDIKKWLINDINEKIKGLKKELTSKNRETTLKKIEKYEKKIEFIKNIKEFVYNPYGENNSKESLSHEEVIQIMTSFINEYPLMQKILISKFPILLIDESQDTRKGLMEAFLNLQQTYSNTFCLGLFGDMMQRIYTNGKEDLEKSLSSDWKKPVKIMNHRSAKRIVRLINRIRLDADGLSQEPRKDKDEGVVHLFLCSNNVSKEKIEQVVSKKMINYTGDDGWTYNVKGYEKLILEHRMAAVRIGFPNLYDSIHKINSYKNSFLDGDLSELKFFTKVIIPLLESGNEKQLQITRIAQLYSPLLIDKTDSKKYLDNIRMVNKSILELIELIKNNKNITCLEVLKMVEKNNLFFIPDNFETILDYEKLNKDIESEEKKLIVWNEVLRLSLNEIKAYDSYVSGDSGFITHQGVKGLQFPRVLMILDDESSKGTSFSYEKLFGVKGKTQTDIKNERDGKETSIDRTRRLLYVGCSRAEKSLAILVYSKNPQQIKNYAIEKQWFKENEIDILEDR